jgi:trans-aconitate methyltransferase
MKSPSYANYEHYIKEGWAREPKESFKALARVVNENPPARLETYLDVGCATGELIGFMKSRFPTIRATGWDVFDSLLETGRRLLPDCTFEKVSATDPALASGQRYDLVTAIGVMSIFDEPELAAFWKNLTGVVADGGLLVVLSPLNEFGCDIVVKHRKRKEGKPLDWERGWNVFSFETIREMVQPLGWTVDFVPFNIGIDLQPAADPVRTWTIAAERNPRQLTNGLKLLINHYFMVAHRV